MNVPLVEGAVSGAAVVVEEPSDESKSGQIISHAGRPRHETRKLYWQQSGDFVMANP